MGNKLDYYFPFSLISHAKYVNSVSKCAMRLPSLATLYPLRKTTCIVFGTLCICISISSLSVCAKPIPNSYLNSAKTHQSFRIRVAKTDRFRELTS